MQMADTHRSVSRALEILLLFVPDTQEMGPAEISRKLGLHPSTVSRLLQVLIRYGFLQQDSVSKKCRLGDSVSSLSKTIRQSFRTRLMEFAKPEIDKLRDRVGDTVSLEVMLGENTAILYRSRGPHPIQVVFDPGERLPVHVAAGAKAVLAFSPPEIVDRLIPGKLVRFTRNTITNRRLLKAHLSEIQLQGFAFDNKELDVHIQAIAVPIFDDEGQPRAAVVLAAPVFRMRAHLKANAVSLVQQTAKRISRLVFPVSSAHLESAIEPMVLRDNLSH
jgi:IclR family transcriptional regulator, KDG regulon repressor